MYKLFSRALIFSLLLLLGGFSREAKAQDPSLVGEWQIDYTTAAFSRSLVFTAMDKTAPQGGSGNFVIPQGPVLIPLFLTPAVWTQITPTIFSFSGEVEYLFGDAGRQTGTLIFKGSFDSLDNISGQVVFVTNQPDSTNPTGFNTMTGKFAGKRVNSAVSDFLLGFDPASITIMRGERGQINVNILRSGGFTGNVVVIAPDTKAIKIKLSPAMQSTTGNSVSFNYKVKKSAPTGTQQLTFIGQDDSGRARMGVLTLLIQ